MAGLIIRQAGEADHGALEELFSATPMGSGIRIGFERGPDYFAGARVQAESPSVWGAFEDDGGARGIFSAGSRRVWVDGEMQVRYLSDLRIHAACQGSFLLARGYRLLRREVFRPGEWAQTLVLENNLPALELLTSRRGGLPDYRPAGRYVSWLLPRQRIAGAPGVLVRPAAQEDLEPMQALLDAASRRRSFAGMVSLHELEKPEWKNLIVGDFLVAERHGAIVGMMGVWDQSGFQRLRIHSYSRAIAALRPLSNAWAKVCGGIALPPAGKALPLRKATAVACHGDEPAILRALLSKALGGNQQDMLLLGFSVQDPLTEALKGLKARIEYGRHFLVGWEGSPPSWREPFAFDAARI